MVQYGVDDFKTDDDMASFFAGRTPELSLCPHGVATGVDAPCKTCEPEFEDGPTARSLITKLALRISELEEEDLKDERKIWACIEEGRPEWRPGGRHACDDAIAEILRLRWVIRGGA